MNKLYGWMKRCVRGMNKLYEWMKRCVRGMNKLYGWMKRCVRGINKASSMNEEVCTRNEQDWKDEWRGMSKELMRKPRWMRIYERRIKSLQEGWELRRYVQGMNKILRMKKEKEVRVKDKNEQWRRFKKIWEQGYIHLDFSYNSFFPMGIVIRIFTFIKEYKEYRKYREYREYRKYREYREYRKYRKYRE